VEAGGVIVQVCLNGARSTDYHPRLPVSAVELAEDAAAAVRVGAAEIHLHVRDDTGGESLTSAAVDASLAAVRAAVPGTLIGVSTGDWIEGDEDRRLAHIAAWRELPDHASVNLSEPGAPAVVELLHRRGIAIEAGLATAADAERLLRLGLAALSLRILIEIGEQDLGAALTRADAILRLLSRASLRKPILLHGFDATVWPLVERAFALGLSTRVGLEDGAALPDGTIAADNAELVRAAVRLRAQ